MGWQLSLAEIQGWRRILKQVLSGDRVELLIGKKGVCVQIFDHLKLFCQGLKSLLIVEVQVRLQMPAQVVHNVARAGATTSPYVDALPVAKSSLNFSNPLRAKQMFLRG